MSKRYTVYTNGQHYVVEADSHKETRRENDGDSLELTKDGEVVFGTSGYYSFVYESEPSYSFHDSQAAAIY